MIEWNYIVVLLCTLLLFFLIWKEVKRKNKSRLLWRILASTVAVVNLTCLALPIIYHTAKQQEASNAAIVLTEGFNADSLSSFLKANPNMPVLYFDKHVNVKQYNAKYIADISLLPQQYKSLAFFHVFGYGFDKEQLQNMPDITLSFHPSAMPVGITAVHWQQQLASGDKLIIQGSYHHASPGTKLVLLSFDMVLDSTYITSDTETTFSLTTVPKSIGRTTYHLAVIANKDTIAKETIPVQVEEGERLKILMLASSPDFDNKFLKNTFAQNGYEIAARTIISKDKYAYDYFNLGAVALNQITTSLLDKFDILIADAAALSAISKSELATIQTAVANKSLGLLIKADSITPSSFYSSSFPLHIINNNTQPLTTYLLDTADKMPSLTTEYLISINNTANTQPLVFDKQNKVYVSSTLYGSGKIIYTTLSNTYSWALSGNEEAYKKYWAMLLNKAAAKPASQEAWSIAPALSFTNMPVQLQLQTNSYSIPQGEVNNATLYFKMNEVLPYQWTGIYFPAKRGWQTGVGLSGKPFYWYAFEKGDWQSINAFEKINTTQQYISNNSPLYKNTETDSVIQENDFPKIYFFLLLLISCTFLWAENKYVLSSNK